MPIQGSSLQTKVKLQCIVLYFDLEFYYSNWKRMCQKRMSQRAFTSDSVASEVHVVALVVDAGDGPRRLDLLVRTPNSGWTRRNWNQMKIRIHFIENTIVATCYGHFGQTQKMITITHSWQLYTNYWPILISKLFRPSKELKCLQTLFHCLYFSSSL